MLTFAFFFLEFSPLLSGIFGGNELKGAHLGGARRRGVENLSRVLPPLQSGPLPGELTAETSVDESSR